MIAENQSKKKEWLTLIGKYQKEMSKIESIVSSSITDNDLGASKNKNISKSSNADWRFPLKEGIVVSTFGTQNDPNNRAVKIKNNGVDIQSKNSFVSAVNNADVLQIRQLPMEPSWFYAEEISIRYILTWIKYSLGRRIIKQRKSYWTM
ncbi:MAG: hypothetical protein IPI90_10430 [Saprospiraceae bacterium]|nr:hypothetical protein [Candidatus Vicinibacter affinis]